LLKVLYLAPNLADPAVARRINMLRLGGAGVDVVGFRRAGTETPRLDVGKYLELDQTFDARFVQRLTATMRASAMVGRWARGLAQPDIIIARNLEMLALGNRLRAYWSGRPALVYECLDIHRLMLREDGIGRAMRAAERRWSRQASLLITSSPAFLRNYFDIHGGPPAVLVENKVIWDGGERGRNPALGATDVPPLRIGWFGALRCARSLEALGGLAASMEGKVEVVLRGRPALSEFDDFSGAVTDRPHLRFEGAYRNPDDLATIYSDVHLAWAIDFFEAGQNSQWLLPNRIYEGCLHGTIPIALAGTETAAFVERHGVGIVVPDIALDTLRRMVGEISPERLVAQATAVAALKPRHFTVTADDCGALVDRLAGVVTFGAMLTEAA
jgi:succinoglycan biosynthesis protein ExoL